jgi:hypothetical protein
MKLWFAYIACVAWFVWAMLFNTQLFTNPAVVGICLVVGMQGWFPAILWLRNGMRALPVFEIYCAFHLPYYAHPALQPIGATARYDGTIQFEALSAVSLFLFTAQCCFYAIMRRATRKKSSHSSRGLLASYRLPDFRRSLLPWLMLWFWAGFEVSLQTKILPNLGDFYRPVSSAVTGIGLFAVFNLASAFGRGEMSIQQKIALATAIVIQGAVELSSGFLVGLSKVAVVFFLSYAMASRRFPVLAISAVFLLMAFLHVGKAEMRANFWSGGNSTNDANPLKIMQFWVSTSFEKIRSGQISSAEAVAKILDRGSLMQMISLALAECPQRREYLHGETYFQLPFLLVPRIFWEAKPRGTWSSETLAIHMGFQTVEDTNYTSIGMGQVAEGWLNFGWLGVIAAGSWFGLLFTVPARLSFDCSADRARMLIAASCLPLATDLEHCLSQWTVIMVNSLLVATAAIYILCRRERRKNSISVVPPSWPRVNV